MDLPNDDLNYEFDSRSNPYYHDPSWAIAINTIGSVSPDPRRDLSPISSGIHGLRQTTMAEHPMMGDWHFQQMQQQQQQQQQQHHHHQHPAHHGIQLQHQQQQHLHIHPHQQPIPHSHHQQHLPLNVSIPSQSHHHHVLEYSQQQQQQSPSQQQQPSVMDPSFDVFHTISMPSQLGIIPVSQPGLQVSLGMDQPYVTAMDSIYDCTNLHTSLNTEIVGYTTTDVGPFSVSPYHQPTNSPTGSHLELLSQHSSSDEHGWTWIDQRNSYDRNEHYCLEPLNTLHDRTMSESSYSDLEQSQSSFLKNLELGAGPQTMHSPTNFSDSDYESYYTHHRLSIDHGSMVPSNTLTRPIPVPATSKGSSPARSPTSQASANSPGRKPSKKSPIVAKGTERVTKKTSQGGRNENEKRVGKRKGPLKPEQRKQANEIRKLRACLRCKFLKKTCDKGEPCAGCQPSHARLWQVPCTRIDIKEIGYFLKDKRFDYERHVSLGFSIGNIKGFADMEKTLFITHGYGHMLPILAREVYVRDDKCLKMDWIEANKNTGGYEVSTAKLSAGTEGISTTMLSDYLDQHIDGVGRDGTPTFVNFVDEYFEGTIFLTQMLKAAFNFYTKTQSRIIKKALKLMLAYNLTLHITMVEGVPPEQALVGKIEDNSSKFCGKTMAPVMINFQIKCAMADMWRELHKDVLEELSALYSSVYSGDKLKNWPTIFMLASVLLAVWECMQFDCHYRVPDEAAVEKFCNDMESTPVGVIVGLFSAISQKLPSILEWDTNKHHALLGSNLDVCDTMTEIQGHVMNYENYLRDRPNAKFDSKDFDSLSNKFLSRLVLRDIRAN